MVSHRCTRCKEDVGENGIRHKFASGLFCEPCMRSLGVKQGRGRGFFGGLWDRIVDFTSSIFRPEALKRIDKRREGKIRVHAQAMMAKALKIPPDPQSVSAH